MGLFSSLPIFGSKSRSSPSAEQPKPHPADKHAPVTSTRVRHYHQPTTSAAACARYEHEPVGSPRTSEDVKRAYLASHPELNSHSAASSPSASRTPSAHGHAEPQRRFS
jgi:hypothetical protein